MVKTTRSVVIVTVGRRYLGMIPSDRYEARVHQDRGAGAPRLHEHRGQHRRLQDSTAGAPSGGAGDPLSSSSSWPAKIRSFLFFQKPLPFSTLYT
jgi:hypothetical protein